MFGKGVYFADMVSKSANYCFTSAANNIGLLLLCEVALGDMNLLTHAEYMDKGEMECCVLAQCRRIPRCCSLGP
jgi:hypothetical protein